MQPNPWEHCLNRNNDRDFWCVTAVSGIGGYATIDGQAIIGFLKNLEVHMPTSTAIHVVLDAARYHTCPEVLAYVKTV